MSSVFLLGAGFSRALSYEMPVMSDLGKQLEDHLTSINRPRGGPPVVQVESWLSYAMTDQPFLGPAQNMQNHAAFQFAQEFIHSYLVRAQGQALVKNLPAWLDDLVTIWHGRRAEVVTLNWDALVEVAVDYLGLGLLHQDVPGARGSIASDNVLTHVPRLAPGSAASGPIGPPSFKLWKLHGSLDWYWSEGDPFGETVVRRPMSRPPSVGDSAGIAGKVPFMVAPTADKSAQYRNQVLRHVWGRAHAGLMTADELVLIGYSLPTTDLAVKSLIAAIPPSIPITVVDKKPELVQKQLSELLGRDEADIALFSDVALFVEERSIALMNHMRLQIVESNEDKSLPVLVALSEQLFGPLSSVTETADFLELRVASWQDSAETANWPSIPAGLTIGELLEQVSIDKPLLVRGPSDTRHLVYSVTYRLFDFGRSTRWMMLRAQAQTRLSAMPGAAAPQP